jgi:hypothetical protein
LSAQYASSVGNAPAPTELHGDAASELRARGGDAGEYGATTGRPRRVGAFDAVATRYACRVQGATEVALPCLDVLGYMGEIPVDHVLLVAIDPPSQRREQKPQGEEIGWHPPIVPCFLRPDAAGSGAAEGSDATRANMRDGRRLRLAGAASKFLDSPVLF